MRMEPQLYIPPKGRHALRNIGCSRDKLFQPYIPLLAARKTDGTEEWHFKRRIRKTSNLRILLCLINQKDEIPALV